MPTSVPTPPLTIRLDESLQDQMEEVAEHLTRIEGEEVTVSDVYREAVTLYLDHKAPMVENASNFVLDE